MDRKELMRPKGWVTDEIMDSYRWVAEVKWDGHSGWLEFDDEGNMSAYTSLRDVTEYLPPVIIPELAGSILQVEFLAENPSRSAAVSIMLSGRTYRAVSDPGIAVFDVIQANQSDLRDHEYCERIPYIEAAANYVRQALEGVMRVPRNARAYGQDKADFYEEVVANGGEGILAKDIHSTYTAGKAREWRKLKVIRTVDAVAYDYTEGGGKYKGTLGALKVGLYRDGELIDVARASGMTDAQRDAFKERLDSGDQFVIELAYQNWTVGNRLRHPRFQRVREDKEPASCTWSDQGPQ